MKKLFTILTLMTLTVVVFAQAPQTFSYQTVIRDNNWQAVSNQDVSIEIAIIEDIASGTVVYKEVHDPTTNELGLVNLAIGSGGVMQGNWTNIDWGNHTYFIEVAVDVTGGTSYIVMGTTQLRSVPYALYAETSGSSTPGPQGLQGIQGLPGDTGATGPQGPIGLTGAQGIQGIQGLPGDTGATGPQGPIGLTGAQGIQGLPGDTGAVGAQGPIGLTGPQGIQGPAGNDGADGTNGSDGTDGVDGAVGAQGPIGLTGPAGNDGADGQDGIDGVDGAVGVQGPIGLTGPQGIQGPAGNDGADGQDGIDGVDGAVGAQGPIGLTGPQGIQGPAGNDGADGQDGIDGVDGAVGAQGPIGLTGPQGIQGPAGSDSNATIHGSQTMFSDSTFIVPDGITTLYITLNGAAGGDGQDSEATNYSQTFYINGCNGGEAMSANIIINCNPGDSITVDFGNAGITLPYQVVPYGPSTASSPGTSGGVLQFFINSLNILSISGGEGGDGISYINNNNWACNYPPGADGAISYPSGYSSYPIFVISSNLITDISQNQATIKY